MFRDHCVCLSCNLTHSWVSTSCMRYRSCSISWCIQATYTNHGVTQQPWWIISRFSLCKCECPQPREQLSLQLNVDTQIRCQDQRNHPCRLDLKQCGIQTSPFCWATPPGWSGTLRWRCWLDSDVLCCCASCETAAETGTLNASRRGWIPSANTETHTEKHKTGRGWFSPGKCNRFSTTSFCWLLEKCGIDYGRMSEYLHDQTSGLDAYWMVIDVS